MRLLMLPDFDLFTRERAMLARLQIGLADEGVRVLAGVPASALDPGSEDEHRAAVGGGRGDRGLPGDEAAARPGLDSTLPGGPGVSGPGLGAGGLSGGLGGFGGLFATTVKFADRGSALTARLRVSALMRSLAEAAPQEPGAAALADVVYAAGAGVWAASLDVARRLGAGLMVEVWSAGLIGEAAALARQGARRGVPVTLLAPDDVMRTALERATGSVATGAGGAMGAAGALGAGSGGGGGAAVRPSAWGVHPAEGRHAPIDVSRSLSVAILASGRDGPGLRQAIDALAMVAREAPTLLAFVDSAVARAQPVWRWATSGAGVSAGGAGGSVAPGLGDRLSVIADLEGRRELVLQADVLLVPEALGEHRSLVLDAMAAGMLVVARPDPMVDWLGDAGLCRLVPAAGAGPLAAALLELVRDAGLAAEVRERARAYVERRRPASGQVRALLEAAAEAASRRRGAGAA